MNKKGHPTYYGEKMRQTAIWLPNFMVEWLKKQPGSMSDTIRNLIKEAIKR